MAEKPAGHQSRRSYVKLVGAAGIAGLAGCSSNGGGASTTTGTETTTATDGTTTGTTSGGSASLKFGLSSFVRGGAWITAYVDAAKYYAKDNGIELDVRPNQQSATKQIQDIRDFANKGYDGIIIGVWQTGAAKTAIEYATKKGVPVVATNADSTSSKLQLYVGFSNYQGGQVSGQQMVKFLKQQYPNKSQYRVLNVRGPQGLQAANERSQGFVDVMKKHDNVQIVKTLNGKFAQDTSQTVVQQWLNSNGAVDGIYSGNLQTGLGVVGALKNLGMLAVSGKKDHIVLTQMDGSPQANKLIEQGYVDAAADQPNYFYNPIAMEYLVEFIRAGGVNGGGASALPKVGSTVSAADLFIKAHQHLGVDLWSKPIWAPATVKPSHGHPWFQTNSVLITKDNATSPGLWGNIWGQK